MKSLSEIETTAKRASRAAGYSWGIAEEVGKSIRLFELFGFPVFYVPIATHPTEKVKRRSGFLAPTLGTSGDLGAVVRVPYFFNLAPHYDLTITPWIVTKGAAIVEGEWRQRFKRGGINFSGIIASPNDKFKSRTVNINDDWQAIINSPFNDPLDLRENNKKLIDIKINLYLIMKKIFLVEKL